MIKMILATDMTCHFGLKDELDGVVMRNSDLEKEQEAAGSEVTTAAGSATEGGSGGGGGVKRDKLVETCLSSELDRTILLKTIMHVSDISNPCKVSVNIYLFIFITAHVLRWSVDWFINDGQVANCHSR